MLPGRARVHVPFLDEDAVGPLTARLTATPGIGAVAANALTGNVLVEYDPAVISIDEIVRGIPVATAIESSEREPHGPGPRGREPMHRTVFPIQGLDRDRDFATTLLERLNAIPGVKARANRLTGRISIEHHPGQVSLATVQGEIEKAIPSAPLPDRGDVERSHYESLVLLRLASVTAAAGSLGLAFAIGRQGRNPVALHVASALAVAQNLPAMRHSLQQALGREGADLAMGLPRFVAMAFAGKLVGLTVLGTEALLRYRAMRAQRELRREREGTDRPPVSGSTGRHRTAHADWYIDATAGLPVSVALGSVLLRGSPERLMPTLLQLAPGAASVGSSSAAAFASLRLAREGIEVPDPSSLPSALRLPDVLLIASDRLLDEDSTRHLEGAPALAHPGPRPLLELCDRLRIRVQVLSDRDRIPSGAAAGVPLETVTGPLVDALAELRRAGHKVALVHNGDVPPEVLAECALSVEVSRDGRPRTRSDAWAPDLAAAARFVETAAAADRAVRDAVGLAALAAIVGTVREVVSPPDLARSSLPGDLSALAAILVAWRRIQPENGGDSAGAVYVDPRPERWGRIEPAEALRILQSRMGGLTAEEAVARLRVESGALEEHPFRDALVGNIRSPLTAFVAAGAALTLLHGGRTDAAVMLFTLAANIVVGTWQEYHAEQIAGLLRESGSTTGRVLRDGEPRLLAADQIVPGDILLLGHGERVAADARVLRSAGLEVDEAALTGESLPVEKVPSGDSDAQRIVLAGSDVVTGHGTAVVVAVGADTRLGATVAALSRRDDSVSPLATRLSELFRQVLPVTTVGGLLVAVPGLLRGQPPMNQVITGFSTALAALPEALPVLAGIGQATAARRLVPRGAVLRKPSAIEALGRVDVACVDKTGTLTEGRLTLQFVATCDREASLPARLTALMRRVVLTGALASPHPESGDVGAHTTDVAIVTGAAEIGLVDEIRVERDREVRFAAGRNYHAAVAAGKLRVKGAPETILPRCRWWTTDGGRRVLRDADRQALAERAREFASRGLRVLMVAEGEPSVDPENPHELTALGFLGIKDPLRRGVPEVVRRCHLAGIRVVMLTGDHPETARAIAHEAGLDGVANDILSGADIASLPDEALDRRMENTSVIARATPLDKLRIIESLRRRGHTIAMTGDGINDAPALRLADVGVAMGRGGTEVARQAADVVLAMDEFGSLVEALVEGRSFWRNLRRSLALLLGGNLGELAFIIGGALLGRDGALTVRQILATNLITDALPAFAVAMQPPETRSLDGLDREGATSLGKPLQREIIHRAIGTAVPALASYVITRRSSGLAQARSVGFGSIVASQLALTVDLGRTQGNLTTTVLGAVGASGAALVGLLTVPMLGRIFELERPTIRGWTMIGAGMLVAPALSRVVLRNDYDGKGEWGLPSFAGQATRSA